MNETPSLDDLALFQRVAEHGNLTAAAREAGVPLPTASRRMTRLEAQTGRILFLRGKAGYALSAEGRALAAETAGLTTLQRRLSRHLDSTPGPRRVRITAGVWTARCLAQRLPPQPTPTWLPEFIPSNTHLDLARREADIGIRNRPPDHPWLARQRTRQVSYAVYGLPDAPSGFVTLPGEPLPPSQAWVHAHHGDAIATTATDPRLCLDLTLAGLGRMVLPDFTAATEPRLIRLSPVIDALTHDEWLVSHHEARHDPPIRLALDALMQVLT
ncbi:DNA-binding transcriptional LysR family regulator [Sagittula marina]|uniref:DNA-binding transcriptional LysR family regulator n=1 Tax=Sagittula marina TaxID=943940 RepID=A0A7W6DQ96_9RHOB|nr:LysR family transcriptional regulator [Sagittula marina]MBB3986977.1 DNA-binding transcriptional LysR family regulator [Sagittula marina]